MENELEEPILKKHVSSFDQSIGLERKILKHNFFYKKLLVEQNKKVLLNDNTRDRKKFLFVFQNW